MNELVNVDCYEYIDTIQDKSIDLIYADPPYFSQIDFVQFNDKWNSIESYLDFMVLRLNKMKRILKDTGSIYVHLDWHASHYIKVEMDKIFGYDNFRNEIVWCYAGGGIPKQDLPRKHDTILRYTKTNTYYFNAPMRKYSPTGNGWHSDGTKYDKVNGMTPHNDWWTDISGLNSMAKEKEYPTQKSILLLERIIKSSSKQGDIIFDPFCGSGTTLVAAKKLSRNYLGCEINKKGCEIAKKRLAEINVLENYMENTT